MGASQYPLNPCRARSAFHPIVHALNSGTVATVVDLRGIDDGVWNSSYDRYAANAAKKATIPNVHRHNVSAVCGWLSSELAR